MSAIQIHNLTKSFGAHVAVDRLSLDVGEGEIFGFLGPNGAGKTTTINLMMGFIRPTGGTCRVHGLNCHSEEEKETLAVKRLIGFVPDTVSFPDFLTGREVLELAARMHGIAKGDIADRIRQLGDEHGLTDALHRYPSGYSLGMRRKLALAHAQIHDPKVFILDEPTNGLDPSAARDIKQWMVRTTQAGKTVFLSTHLLDMAERYCGRVGVIVKGQLKAVSSPDDLKTALQRQSLEDVFFAVTETEEATR